MVVFMIIFFWRKIYFQFQHARDDAIETCDMPWGNLIPYLQSSTENKNI